MYNNIWGLPHSLVSEESVCSVGDLFDSCVEKIPRRKWQPLQYSCLENPIWTEELRATTMGVAKSEAQLSN